MGWRRVGILLTCPYAGAYRPDVQTRQQFEDRCILSPRIPPSPLTIGMSVFGVYRVAGTFGRSADCAGEYQCGGGMLTMAAAGCYDAILFWWWGTMREREPGKNGITLAAVVCLTMAYAAGMGWFNVNRYERGGGDLDLGVVTQVLWNTCHGNLLWSTGPGVHAPIFREHFDVVYLPLSVLYAWWPDPRLLLWTQTLILATGIPLTWLAVRTRTGDTAALVLAGAYAASPVTQYINLFDFHPVTLAVPVYLAAFACWQRGRHRATFLLLGLSLLINESMSVTIAAIGMLFLLSGRVRHGLACLAAGLCAYLLLIGWVLPAFAPPGGEPAYFYTTYFSYLPGDTGAAKLLALLHDPGLLVRQALMPATAKYLFLLVLGFGGLPLLAPRWWLVMAPQLLFNLLSGFEGTRTIYQQYNAPLLPFLIMAAADGAVRLRLMLRGQAGWKFPLLLVIAGTLLLHRLDSPLPLLGTRQFIVPGNKTAERFAQAGELLQMIPGGASVGTEYKYWAYLSARREIFLFFDPMSTAEYYLLDLTDNCVPPDIPDTTLAFARRKISDEGFVVAGFRDGIVLLVRGGGGA